MTRWLHAKAPTVFFALTLLFTVGPGSSHEYYPSRVAWDRFTGGQLNISTFSFRDVNRNGVYDIADHPMSGVAFEVTGPGTTIFRRTNKSGFGNFAMSIHNKNSDIKNRGEYAFLAIVPSGWRLTTDNASQKIVFEIMPGTPADVVASTPLEPVGLAQDLTITGKLLHSTEIAPVQLSAISPAGEEQEVSVDEAGLFSFPVADGNWTVVAKNAVGNLLITRGIEVSVAPVVVAALVPEELQHEIRQRSTLISFDDLVTEGIKEIPSGYHGLNWHNWVVTHQKFHDGEGYVNTTMSGEFVAYNGSGHQANISREQPFDFIGGYFGSAWLQEAEGETLHVKGWRDDALAYDENIELSALGSIYFYANFRDITRLELRTQHYWQVVCDDLEFAVPN